MSADGAAASAAKAAKPVRGVCKGVPKCKVIGRFDVTGNGRKDQVGLVNRDRYGHIGKARVTVRVKTDRGRVLKKRVPVRNWKGAVWYGKAAIDGRRGAELVLGAKRRKHTQDDPFPGSRVTWSKAFHVITFRPGKGLVKARTPKGASSPNGARKLWWLTGPNGVRSSVGGQTFYSEYGWWRKTVNGQVRIAQRMLSVGGVAGPRGTKSVWVWRNGKWRKLGSRSIQNPMNKKYGGWHVKGLRVW